MFMPEGLYDQCPCLMELWQSSERGRGHFKYFNMWGKDAMFIPLVKQCWGRHMYGKKMYQVVQKLKTLKQPLRELNKNAFANVELSAQLAQVQFKNTQTALHGDPTNLHLQEEEHLVGRVYKDMVEARDSFLAQKANVHWLKDGDSNSYYFHNHIKKRRMVNRVLSIVDMNGNLQSTMEGIENAFLEYYEKLSGTRKAVKRVHYVTVRQGKTVTEGHASILMQPVTPQEVKEALFSIPATKAPGPDGFSSQFFKDAYGIAGKDVEAELLSFFRMGNS
ncbi:uncharacterized protein LOC141632593 [Silene latifolia]|uniref:uncharacterized protein LOC141632593 n=1 Tax=Silene latifolia TaxID=37657 RepID=UPI003D773A10